MKERPKLKLRISSGSRKGYVLDVPNNIKPVKNVVKLAIFDILRDKIEKFNCLDLFCGSGNLGLEALSKGAKSCTFVDNNKDAIEAVTKNVSRLGFTKRAYIKMMNAEKFLTCEKEKFDIIFLDPPYSKSIDKLTKKLLNSLKSQGILIYLHSRYHKYTWEAMENAKVLCNRTYGKTTLTLIKHL